MQSRFLALATCLWRLLGWRFTVKQHGVADQIASVVASERFERLWLVNASALDQQTEQNEDDQHGAQGDEVDPEATVPGHALTGARHGGKHGKGGCTLLVQPTDFDGLVANIELSDIQSDDPFEPFECPKTPSTVS